MHVCALSDIWVLLTLAKAVHLQCIPSSDALLLMASPNTLAGGEDTGHAFSADGHQANVVLAACA